MKETTRGVSLGGYFEVRTLEVSKMDKYRVHHIQFSEERGSSLPTVLCPPHTEAKDM